ncbi:MAG: hypothetical protein JW849_03555 [Phycisphaerae bacterium]|nr:hypothetical protein [Phycisphaerae bacterium]
MNLKKTIGWGSVIFLFALMLATAIVFLIASAPPAEYRPYQLTQKERREAAHHFVDHQGAVFFNKIHENLPFTHVITESDLNMYLASLDEIAFLKPVRRGREDEGGRVLRAMDKAGLSDPAVKLGDGVMTFMVQTRKARKVVSFDLAFEFDDNDRMRIALREVRVGRMPVPQAVLSESIEALKRGVRRPPSEKDIGPEDFDEMLAGLVLAMGDEPVSTNIRFGRKRIRKLRDVEVKDGKLKIHIVPASREEAEGDSED